MSAALPRRRVLLLISAVLSLLYVVRIWSSDLWWHLATGRHIVEQHTIPRVDPFSFTVTGAPWRSVDWLADLIVYGFWSAGGVFGLTAYTVLAAFAWLYFLALALRELDLEWPATAGALACVAVLVQPRYSITRPMVLGAVLLSASLWLCLRWWRRRDRSLYALPLVIALWIGVHPTVVLGAALPGVVLAAALGTRLLRSRDPAPLVAPAVALGACVLVLLVTPGGRGILGTAADLDRTPLATALTLEWERTTLRAPKLWVPALLVALSFAVSMRRLRLRILPLGLALLGAIVATRYLRNLYEALLLATPLVGLVIADAVAALERKKLALLARMLPLLVPLSVTVAHLQLVPEGAFNSAFGVGFDKRLMPEDTVATLRALPTGRTIHDCTLGGYLMWHRVPVYCDTRTVALYDQARISELFLPLYQGEPAIEAVSDRYDIRYGLARRDSDFERGLMRSSRWLPLHLGRDSTLFVRRARVAGIDPAQLLDDLRFVNDPEWMARHYRAAMADPIRAAVLERAIVRAVGQTPSSPTLLQILAHLQRAHPTFAESAKRALETALPAGVRLPVPAVPGGGTVY